MKKILFIKNNINSKLTNNNFHVKIEYINSINLAKYSNVELENLILEFDIIILGGGPQHLTNPEINDYPEIIAQVQIIKLTQKLSKILIGICLGCQIIGHTFGMGIQKMPKLCLGFNNLDKNSINFNYIKNTQDTYLSNMDFNLLAKSFSYHYDYIDWIDNTNNTDAQLVKIAQSIHNVPYIIKHSQAKIYGFQFHPEISIECIQEILQTYNYNLDNAIRDFDCNISTHFLDIFIKN